MIGKGCCSLPSSFHATHKTLRTFWRTCLVHPGRHKYVFRKQQCLHPFDWLGLRCCSSLSLFASSHLFSPVRHSTRSSVTNRISWVNDVEFYVFGNMSLSVLWCCVNPMLYGWNVEYVVCGVCKFIVIQIGIVLLSMANNYRAMWWKRWICASEKSNERFEKLLDCLFVCQEE